MISCFIRAGFRRFNAMAAQFTVLAIVVCSLGVASLHAQPPPATPKVLAPVTEAEIQASIKRGIEFLKSRAPNLDAGYASLVAMALLKAGVPADTPVIQAVIKKILRCVSTDGKFTPANPHTHVYESGVSLMALANADARLYKPQIQAIANYLISVQGPEGDWDYPTRSTGDTSMSQYAILGLWEAVRSGVTVPTAVWNHAAKWHVTRQLADGSFTYHPTGSEGTGTHSMTQAGLGSLHVVRMHLYPDARDIEEQVASAARKRGTRKRYGVLEPADADPDEEARTTAEVKREPDITRPTVRLSAIDKGISHGLGWLGERFTVDPQSYTLYYLYGIERLAALANLEKIGGHDWYAEGSSYLVSTQTSNGSWNDSTGGDPATAFAVLFLSKATSKMLQRKPRAVSRFGAGLLAGGRGLPDNLNEVQFDKGKVQVRKLVGPVDELLAELENAQSRNIESAQAALVDTALIEKPEELIGRKERLVKLVRDPRPEVRRTALWALGRTNDIRTAPLLIDALQDTDLDCMVEARNALQFISKKKKDPDLPDQPTEAQRAAAVARWRKWYRSIRPYDERDDLPEATGS